MLKKHSGENLLRIWISGQQLLLLMKPKSLAHSRCSVNIYRPQWEKFHVIFVEGSLTALPDVTVDVCVNFSYSASTLAPPSEATRAVARTPLLAGLAQRNSSCGEKSPGFALICVLVLPLQGLASYFLVFHSPGCSTANGRNNMWP